MTNSDKAAAVLDAFAPWPDTCPKCGSATTPATLGNGRLQALCCQCLAWVFWNREQAIRIWRVAEPWDVNLPWDSILLAETDTLGPGDDISHTPEWVKIF